MIRQNAIKGFSIFVVIVTISLGTIGKYYTTNLENWHISDMERLAEEEWGLLESALIMTNDYGKSEGRYLRSEIHSEIKSLDLENEELIFHLDSYIQPNNPVRQVLTSILKDYRFKNIDSDSTDPFVTLGDSIVYDQSGDCSLLGSFRTFGEEYPMHANPDLAESLFYNISKGSQNGYLTFFQFLDHPNGENIRKDYPEIYDEFKNKKALVLNSYNLKGLKEKYMESYSWEEVFLAYEFIATTYIYEKQDLSGRNFIENGMRTEVDRLAINLGYNFKYVIDATPHLITQLEKYDWERARSKAYLYSTLFTLILVELLLLIICVTTMVLTLKILGEDNERNSNII